MTPILRERGQCPSNSCMYPSVWLLMLGPNSQQWLTGNWTQEAVQGIGGAEGAFHWNPLGTSHSGCRRRKAETFPWSPAHLIFPVRVSPAPSPAVPLAPQCNMEMLPRGTATAVSCLHPTATREGTPAFALAQRLQGHQSAG